MKNYKKKAVFLGLVTLALLAVGLSVVSPVCAQPTDLCIRGIVQEDEHGPLAAVERFTINMHLETSDGIHFSVWGKVNIRKEPYYVGGTGILEGNSLTMNLTSSQKHTSAWRDSGVMQVNYNIATGRGTFYEIGHDFNTARRVYDERYSAGVLRQCP